MDRLERLVNLVAALIDTPRPLSRNEIRGRIEGYSPEPEAFRRNFERDKDLLRQMGFPLVVEVPEGANPDEAGYRIPRELYELPDPKLDEDEMTALRLAASVVQMEGEWSDALVGALRKLGGGAGPPEVPGRSTVLPAAALPVQEAAATAFAAVGERQQVTFRYHGETRVVDPWRLSYARGNWYLSGWDHTREEERQFRLDRIEGDLSATGSTGAFERPAAGHTRPPRPWQMGDEDDLTVSLWVDADHTARAALELGPDAAAQDQPDGSTVFEVHVTNRQALISFAVGFLDHAEVLGPPEMRQAMVAWLESVP
jgi:proteasome accessory factor B